MTQIRIAPTCANHRVLENVNVKILERAEVQNLSKQISSQTAEEIVYDEW